MGGARAALFALAPRPAQKVFRSAKRTSRTDITAATVWPVPKAASRAVLGGGGGSAGARRRTETTRAKVGRERIGAPDARFEDPVSYRAVPCASNFVGTERALIVLKEIILFAFATGPGWVGCCSGGTCVAFDSAGVGSNCALGAFGAFRSLVVRASGAFAHRVSVVQKVGHWTALDLEWLRLSSHRLAVDITHFYLELTRDERWWGTLTAMGI